MTQTSRVDSSDDGTKKTQVTFGDDDPGHNPYRDYESTVVGGSFARGRMYALFGDPFYMQSLKLLRVHRRW